MNALNRLTLFELLFLTTLLAGAFFAPTLASSDSFGLIEAQYITSQDEYGPDIFDWGIEGEVGSDATVTPWVNVSSADPGLLNVSFVVIADHDTTTKTLMTPNGTYYTLDTSIFIENHHYNTWIEAFDTALNSTVSTNLIYKLYDEELRPQVIEWGIGGNVGTDIIVTAWANVSDVYPSILNVSLVIITDHVETLKTLMTSNGTHYTLATFTFEDNHYYKVWIETFDNSLNSTVSNSLKYNFYDDTLRPEIQAWGISGSLIDDATYTVWANISDTNSGVLNVSVYVQTDNTITAVELLIFTGSSYQVAMPQLGVNHTYTLWIVTFDNALNNAESYDRNFDFSFGYLSVADPLLSAPIVIPASLAMFACVTVVAFIKHKRDEQLETDLPAEIVEDAKDDAEEKEPRPHLLDELERDN